jgi:hypothetical protein
MIIVSVESPRVIVLVESLGNAVGEQDASRFGAV